MFSFVLLFYQNFTGTRANVEGPLYTFGSHLSAVDIRSVSQINESSSLCDS